MAMIIFNECRMTYSYFLLRNGLQTTRLSVYRNFDVEYNEYFLMKSKVIDFLEGKSEDLSLFFKTYNFEITNEIKKGVFHMKVDIKDHPSTNGLYEVYIDYKNNEKEISKYLNYLFPDDDDIY